MKYLGSKRRIAHYILPIILDEMIEGDYFVDLFCGGCNLLDKVPDTFKRIANDKNEYLIEMWKAIIGGWQPPLTIDRELYSYIREKYNKRDFSCYGKDVIGWGGFMVASTLVGTVVIV